MNGAKKLVRGVVCAALALCAMETWATASWSTGPFTSASWAANPSNMLRTATISSSGLAQLADGQLVQFGSNGNVSQYTVVTWTLVGEATIYGVNVFTKYSDSGRDGIDVAKLEVKTAESGDQWVDLGAPAVEYGTLHLDGSNKAHDGISGTFYAKYADDGGAALATRVTAFRMTFGPYQDNNKTGYGEIELVGVSSAGWKLDLSRPLTSLATISLSPEPDANGYYPDGTSVTMSLTPADGVSFLRWSGDLPAESVSNATVTFTMVGTRAIKSYLNSASFAYQDGIISDGWQQYRVSESSGKLTVAGVVELGEGNSANLAKPIAGGKTITTIGGNAFISSKIVSLVLPDTLTSIGRAAFQSCSLVSLVLPNSLERLDWCAFASCGSLKSVSPMFPDSLVYYGGGCFANAHDFTGNVRIGFGTDASGSPLSVTFEIHDTTSGIQRGLQFQSQTLGPNIALGPGVTSIPAYTFRNCSIVTNLALSANLTSIATSAFEKLGQSANASVVFEGDKPTLAASAFSATTPAKVRFLTPWHGGTLHPAWTAFLADTTKVTPWESLSDQDKSTYAANFPGKMATHYPYGQVISSSDGFPAGSWICAQKSVGLSIFVR